MNKLAQLLKEHYVNFPELEIQDAVKFLCQHFMGPGHLIQDDRVVLDRLTTEWNSVQADESVPLFHPVGNGLYRLNISACKAIGLSISTVARLFILSAQQFLPNPDGLKSGLDSLFSLPFSREEAASYLANYRAQGCPMVSHSPRFRQLYSPSYRLVREYYVNLISALAAIDRTTAVQPRLRVGIDGPCACGKSSLGKALSEIYNCPLIHMDDFFLQPEQRTPERLARPGENVDHERFSREILAPLLAGTPVHYRPYLCHSNQFGSQITVEPAALTVVEGSYCLRPDLRDAFDLRIWIEAPWEVRRKRLLERGGEDCLARFESVWIPLENNYFDACRVSDCCHVHLCGVSSKI